MIVDDNYKAGRRAGMKEVVEVVRDMESSGGIVTAAFLIKRIQAKMNEPAPEKRTVGRPKGRRCTFCGGEGVIYPSDQRPERVCGHCQGEGVVK